MKQPLGLLLIVIIFLFSAVIIGSTRLSAEKAPGSCRACHDDFSGLLPPGHEVVVGDTIADCDVCHRVERSVPKVTAPYVTRLHQAHLPPRGDGDCLVCHFSSGSKGFGLLGSSESWGSPSGGELQLLKEIMVSWAGSNFLDGLHGQAKVSCSACHGAALPGFDATVANATCLSCHGPMEQLAKKTEPADFKDRNPHQSHLGEIDCTVCHKGHGESKVYCLGCHQKFVMNIPAGGQAKGVK